MSTTCVDGIGRKGATDGRSEGRPNDSDDARRAHAGQHAGLIDAVARSMGPERYRRYFPHGGRVRREGQRIEIEAPSRFVADMLMRRFSDSIREAAEAALGETALQISVRVRAEREEGSASGDAPGRAVPTRAASSAEGAWGRPAEQAPKRRAVRRRERSRLRRLDDFVVGACNHLAHRAAMTLTEDACPPGFSPLFIHGACGLGKTHLLQGVTRRFLERRPEAKVRCVTGEEFTFGYVSALRSGKADAFRAAHRDLDLLCIDDVHFLSSKSATQQEFLHTFNAIGMDGARVALASDEHPSRLRSFSKELISRFLSGMVVELKPMDQETRLRFARQTAARRELRIDEAGLALVAARCEESAREIEGAVTRIAALHRLARGGEGVVGPDLVEEALGPDPDERPTRPIKMSLIAERVCSTLRVEPSELLGRSRHKRVVLARSLTAHLGRKLTTLSYPELAREMNRPNHSTVVTACQRVERALETHACCEAGVEFEGETYQSLIARLKREIVRASM